MQQTQQTQDSSFFIPLTTPTTHPSLVTSSSLQHSSTLHPSSPFPLLLHLLPLLLLLLLLLHPSSLFFLFFLSPSVRSCVLPFPGVVMSSSVSSCGVLRWCLVLLCLCLASGAVLSGVGAESDATSTFRRRFHVTQSNGGDGGGQPINGPSPTPSPTDPQPVNNPVTYYNVIMPDNEGVVQPSTTPPVKAMANQTSWLCQQGGGTAFDDMDQIGAGWPSITDWTWAGGSALDSIQMNYAPPTPSGKAIIGNKHGGDGGTAQLPITLQTNEFINHVSVWCKDWVQQLAFNTNQGRGWSAGQQIGNYYEYHFPGLVLGWIGGRSNQYFSLLALNWVPPTVTGYVLSSVSYNNVGVVPTAWGPPQSAIILPLSNPTSATQTVSATVAITSEASSTWSFGFTETIGVTVSGSVGIPLLAEGKVEVSSTTAFSYTTGSTYTQSSTVSPTLTVTAPPCTSMEGEMVVQPVTATVNFTASIMTVYSDGTTSTSTSQQGSWAGVAAFRPVTSYTQLQPPPNCVNSTQGGMSV